MFGFFGGADRGNVSQSGASGHHTDWSFMTHQRVDITQSAHKMTVIILVYLYTRRSQHTPHIHTQTSTHTHTHSSNHPPTTKYQSIPVSVPDDASSIFTACHYYTEWLAGHHTVDRPIMTSQMHSHPRVT